MRNEFVKSLAWVGRLHKVLANQEASETGLTEGTDGIGIADATFADLDGILGQKLGETEAVLDIRHKRTEVAVVDAAEVGAEVSIFQLRLGVHLKEHLKS